MKILSYEECKKELSKISTYGPNDITIGSEDLKTIAKNKSILVMSVFESCGSYAGREAIKSAVLDFEKNELPLKEADGILVYFKMNTHYPIMELADAMEVINDRLYEIIMGDEPSVIWGISCDDNMKTDCVKAAVFMSYAKQKRGHYANNYIVKSMI